MQNNDKQRLNEVNAQRNLWREKGMLWITWERRALYRSTKTLCLWIDKRIRRKSYSKDFADTTTDFTAMVQKKRCVCQAMSKLGAPVGGKTAEKTPVLAVQRIRLNDRCRHLKRAKIVKLRTTYAQPTHNQHSTLFVAQSIPTVTHRLPKNAALYVQVCALILKDSNESVEQAITGWKRVFRHRKKGRGIFRQFLTKKGYVPKGQGWVYVGLIDQ